MIVVMQRPRKARHRVNRAANAREGVE